MANGTEQKQVSGEAEARIAALEKRVRQLEEDQRRQTARLTATIASPDAQRLTEIIEDARAKPLTAVLTVLAVIVVGLLLATLLGYFVFHSIVESRPT